jgi:hypothetical protein
MRERVDLKSPVRENRPPGSVRGAPGNRRPYRDIKIRVRPKNAPSPASPDLAKIYFNTTQFLCQSMLLLANPVSRPLDVSSSKKQPARLPLGSALRC